MLGDTQVSRSSVRERERNEDNEKDYVDFYPANSGCLHVSFVNFNC